MQRCYQSGRTQKKFKNFRQYFKIEIIYLYKIKDYQHLKQQE